MEFLNRSFACYAKTFVSQYQGIDYKPRAGDQGHHGQQGPRGISGQKGDQGSPGVAGVSYVR